MATAKRRISEIPYSVHQMHTARMTNTWSARKYTSKITPTSDSP
jgi:hypothetical protein